MEDIINKIFDLFLNEKTFSKYGIKHRACYWKMGTSFFKIFDRLYENIINIDISKPMITIYNLDNKTTQGNNDSYKFTIDNINVTPCKVRGYVASTTIQQYMRSITSFGLGIVEKKFKNYNDFVLNQGEIKLAHNIKWLLNKNNRINLIKKVIVDSFFSNIEDTRNIAYSIIIEFLLSQNFDFKTLKLENRIFYWNKMVGKQNQKDKKCADLTNDLNEIKEDIFKKGTKATYKEIIDCLKKNYSSISDFICDIWEEYISKSYEDNKTYENINSQIEKTNIISQINSERSKFKKCIFDNRKQLGLIKNQNDLYTDLVDFKNNLTDDLVAKFNEAEAAHIYDIYQIKNEALNIGENDNEKKNKLIKLASNPNNGLIMKHEYHKSFDRNQWTFDSNGNMIVPFENQEYLFNILGLKRIKINAKVLTNEMKNLLTKR